MLWVLRWRVLGWQMGMVWSMLRWWMRMELLLFLVLLVVFLVLRLHTARGLVVGP